MIDFRYHLVSIVAVFLALTVGIVLGTTMLQDPLLHTLKSETADLRGQSEDLRAERDTADRVNAGADELASAAAEDMLDGRLRDLGVAMVAVPGADGDVVAALGERVEEAGGEVVGRVEFTGEFLDGDNAAFIDELAIQAARDPDELSGGPYDKAGTEIGRALARVSSSEDEDGEEDGDEGDGDGEARSEESDDDEDTDAEGSGGSGDGVGADDGAEAVLAAFTEGGLIAVGGEPAESADAVVVVAPASGAFGDDFGHEAANAALTKVTAALEREVGPTVLAGGVATAAGDGLLAHARGQDPSFATVDVAGRPMGDIVTVLALADNLEGSGAAYGIGEGVEGFLPDPPPGPLERSGSRDNGDGDSSGDGDGTRRASRDGE